MHKASLARFGSKVTVGVSAITAAAAAADQALLAMPVKIRMRNSRQQEVNPEDLLNIRTA